MELLETARGAIRINVIAQRAAAMAEGAAQDKLDRASQCRVLRNSEFVRWRQRMNASCKKGFIHIDVSESRHDFLIQ